MNLLGWARDHARPLRADAARNRALLLAAAADEFAEHGLEASVADIARRAGVGKGTVFRHFPTKDDLIAAIVLDRIEDLRASGERLLTADDPGDALLEFLIAAGHTAATGSVVPDGRRGAEARREAGPGRAVPG